LFFNSITVARGASSTTGGETGIEGGMGKTVRGPLGGWVVRHGTGNVSAGGGKKCRLPARQNMRKSSNMVGPEKEEKNKGRRGNQRKDTTFLWRD